MCQIHHVIRLTETVEYGKTRNIQPLRTAHWNQHTFNDMYSSSDIDAEENLQEFSTRFAFYEGNINACKAAKEYVNIFNHMQSALTMI